MATFVRFTTKLRFLPNLLPKSNCTKNIVQKFRSIQTTSAIFQKKSADEKKILQRRFDEKDKANFGDLVYLAPEKLAKQMVPIKLISLFVSASGMYFQYVVATEVDITIFAAICMVLTPVSLGTGYFGYWITKRFVSEMFFNPETQKYTTIMKNFFGFNRALTFGKSDLRPPLSHAAICSAFVNGYPLLLFPPNYLSEKAFEDITNVEFYGMDETATENQNDVAATENQVQNEDDKKEKSKKMSRKL